MALIRNRAWTCGFFWGFKTLRATTQDPKLKDRVPTVTAHELQMDPDAINELLAIGKEELLDVEGLDV